MFKPKPLLRYQIACLVLFILISACHKRYWQRRVVHVQRGKQSIKVVVDNKVPYVFKDGFNVLLKKSCEKEFEKMGYSLIYKDTPDFVAHIRIDLDSFPVNGVYVLGKGGPSSFWQAYKKTKVYALLFDYKISHMKNNAVKWEEHNDIYYFEDVYRNSSRATNMIKYTIRYGK